jgi:hypothetical protein
MYRCQQHGALQETMALHHISKEEQSPPSVTLLSSWIPRNPHCLIFCPLMLLIRFRQSKKSDVHFTTSTQWRDTSYFNTTMHNLTWNITSGANQDMVVKFSLFWTCSFQTLEDYEKPAIQEQCQSRKLCIHGFRMRKWASTIATCSRSYNSGRNGWTVGGILWKCDRTSPTKS